MTAGLGQITPSIAVAERRRNGSAGGFAGSSIGTRHRGHAFLPSITRQGFSPFRHADIEHELSLAKPSEAMLAIVHRYDMAG
jgi:hypothetical protein